MKYTKKRFLALVLAVCMFATMLPMAANAAASADSTVYNFDLRSVYGNKASLVESRELIAANYGVYGWCLQDYNTPNTMQFESDGLRLYTNETDWIAFKIKAPGAGVYTLSLNYTNSVNSGTVAAYILPANETDIDRAISSENCVGKAVLTNLVSSSNEAATAYFGTWDFSTAPAEEYILVLEANRHSVYSDSNCNMRLKQLIMTPGNTMPQTQQQAIAYPVTANSSPVKISTPAPYYGVTTQVGGSDCLFMPIKGGKMLVFDLDKNVLVNEVDIPFSIARGMAVDQDGVVWCVGEGTDVFRYDPETRIGETVIYLNNITEGAQDAMYLHYEDGYLYFGIFPKGVICKYKIADGTYETFGPFHADCHTVSAIIPQGDYIYAGISGDVDGVNGFTSQIIKVNAKTGVLEDYLDLSSGSETAAIKLNENHRQFNGVAIAGNLLLMGSSASQSFTVAVDVRTMDFVDVGLTSGIEFDITEPVQIGEKTYIYFYSAGKIYSLDVTGVTEDTVLTDNITIQLAHKNFTGWVNPKPLRCGKNSIVEVDDPALPGKNIVTYYTADGYPRLLNIETGKTKILEGLVEAGYGSAMPARPLISGLPGSNELYMGAFNTPKCAIYNTQTGTTTNFESNSDQTDAFVFYGGVLYTGNYNDASISRINPEGENEKLLSMKQSHNQARVHTLTAGGGKVFAGTTPYTGYGGCLAWVDVNTGETYVQRNIVNNQSINCLVYQDGLVFGTTYVSGGSGSAVIEGQSAKLFVFDVASNSKVAEFDLRDAPYNTELGIDASVAIDYIAGIAADPDVPGKFWGIVSQTLFSFTYENGKLSVTKELSFGENSYNTSGGRGSFPRPFCFDGEGNLYVSFDAAGGVRRINTENPADNTRLPLPVISYYALGEDGNLYYTWGDELRMYPLNITDDDWARAQSVDDAILAVGTQITLEDTAQIRAARSAYNALSLKEQALVQQLYLLEELEADLLEAQIGQLPQQITYDIKTQLDALWDTYTAMTDRQKTYIKNYDRLVNAINAQNAMDGTVAYQVADKNYYDISAAIAAAAAGDKIVTLIADAVAADICITDGVQLDLNGYTLSVNAITTDIVPDAWGFVVDSSAGNEGLLVVGREDMLLRADNPDVPLYDAQKGGYRFFDYKLTLHRTTTNVGEGREKFWFKFHFYTDDACTVLDQDAYDLVAAGNANMEISTALTWNGKKLPEVYFGKNGNTDAFSQNWATGATESRWLYVTVSGLDAVGAGTLRVEPIIEVNNVRVSAGNISYEKQLTIPEFGWDHTGPGGAAN